MLKKNLEVDVVVISFAKDETIHNETLKCLETLFDSENSSEVKFNAFVVETNKEIDYDSLETKGHTIQTIRTDKPFGYHTYLNVGLEKGSAEWTCLCNNDLVFHEKWASKILNVIDVQRKNNESAFEYVSASPLNPKEKWHQTKINQLEVGYGVRQHITGWCLFQSRNVFEKIGGLEEKIKFWFCDNWYSVAMQWYKIPHILVGNSIVEHHAGLEGTTTSNVDLSKEEKHNLTYGAGEEFREIVREMIGNPNWGKPTEEQKKEYEKKTNKKWY